MPHSLAPTPGPSAPSLVSGEPSIERRLRVLRSLAVLDSEPEESFDGLTQAACAIAGFPVALMALADADRLWFKSRVGWPSPEIALTSSAFCWHVLTSRRALQVPDAAADDRFADDTLVTGPAARTISTPTLLPCSEGSPARRPNCSTPGAMRLSSSANANA